MIRWMKNLFIGSKKNDFPTDITVYIDHYKKPNRNLPWYATRWVALDTETTGFQKESQILSIGAVAITDGFIDVSDSLEIILQNDGEWNGESTTIHGIMPDHSRLGMSQQNAIATLLTYISSSPIIAHNATYDINMINNLIRKFYPFKLKNKVLDTADLAVRLEKFGTDEASIVRKDFTLDQLCLRYRIPIHDRHTAAGDALLTAQLFQKLMSLAQKRKIIKLGDIFT